jgi:hypothetical protein
MAQIGFGIKHRLRTASYPMKESLMTPAPENTDWLSIAEQVGEEVDPAKLRTLVKQLCTALEDRRKATSPLTGPSGP